MAPVSDAIRRAAGSVEDFRGDYEGLATMMQASWGESPAASYLYSAELLADCFTYPGASHWLAPSIYDGLELVAFAAGFPRRVLIGGIERRVVISTFLTVAPEHKASGYGIVVWSELMRRAAAAGFDGAINYCVDHGPMDRMIGPACAAIGLPVAKAASFFYLTSPVTAAATLPPSPTATVQQLLSAASDLRNQLGICRLWTAPEAAWQLSRVGTVSASSGGDGAGGHVRICDPVQRRSARRVCLVIDDILWRSAEAAERVELVRRLAAAGAAAGATGAAVPLTRLRRHATVPGSRLRALPAHAERPPVAWSETTEPARAPGYYLDVQ